ncbi:MAG: lactonase family protein [Prolixibacteraceae bacterium]
MKTSFSVLVLSGMFLLSCKPEARHLLYVGTYTDGDSEGIYCYQYHPETGDLVLQHVTENKENPSFLALHPNGKYLYAVSEVNDYQQMDSGSVTAYRIAESGELEKINQEATKGNHPCHVTVSPDGKTVVAANYTSGSISIYQTLENGGLSEVLQVIRHDGQGPDSTRQKGPHAHSALFTKDGSLLITADLGTDRIDFYRQSPEKNQPYVPASEGPVHMPPGSGPRHFDFSPDGQFIYVMNEMGSSVSVLQRDGAAFRLIETVSSLPAGYTDKSYGADIHVAPDGRFVYCSNRGHNSIAVFSRDQGNGKISLIQNEPVSGDWPRNFTLDPDGNYLLVANQKSNNVTIFKVDKESGLLSYSNQNLRIPSPVCLKFLVR